MVIKGLIDEDFVNYKKPAMYIAFPSCSFKCCEEGNFPIEVCQNCSLAKANNVEITAEQIINRYMSNPITSAIVCGGLEPFDSPFALPELIEEFRKYTSDDIVIYTGYREEELLYGFASLREAYDKIKQFKNIIIKFGRFVPNQQPHYDEVLGVKLISDNQYAERIS